LKNLWIFKRQADGEWKFWRIMFNSTISPEDELIGGGFLALHETWER
jgi:hypothetical protein